MRKYIFSGDFGGGALAPSAPPAYALGTQQLAENAGCKNYTKNRHLHTIAQLRWAISSQLRMYQQSGKNVKQQYLLHMSSQYGELWPTNG